MGPVPGHNPAALRHQVVLGMGFRSPARRAGDAPALPAQDARLDEVLGWLERRGGGEAEGGLGVNASKVVERSPGAVDDPQCLWRPEGERMKGDPNVNRPNVNPDAQETARQGTRAQELTGTLVYQRRRPRHVSGRRGGDQPRDPGRRRRGERAGRGAAARQRGAPAPEVGATPARSADPDNPEASDPGSPAGVRTGRKLGGPPFAADAREGAPASARGARPSGPDHGLRHMARSRRRVREAGIRIAALVSGHGDPRLPTEKGDRSCL